jgi:hypothetical protein
LTRIHHSTHIFATQVLAEVNWRFYMLNVVDRCGTENHLSSIVNSFDYCHLSWNLLDHHLFLKVFIAEVKFVSVIVL